MGYLKGKSSLMIFDRHANLKYKYGNRHFWARGYFVDTVGKNKKKIQEYIRNQLQQDQIADQLSLKEFVDPFTGSKETKGKSSLMIFDRHANLKYKYGNRHFWARGYFVDTVRWMPCPIPVN